MRIFLSGPMGSGKSTVAGLVAERTGLVAYDLDAEIEAGAGASVSELFASRGEEAFRRIEAGTLAELLERSAEGVVALGGGAVLDDEGRRRLLSAGVLITLTGSPRALAERVGSGEGRPLLAAGEPEETLAEVLQRRRGVYAEAHGCIDTSGRDPSWVADRVLEVARERPLVVPLGERSYTVEIGSGLRSRIGDRTARVARSGRVLVVTDDNVAPHWLDAARESLLEADLGVEHVVLPAGEEHKRLSTVESIWEAAQSAGLDRGTAVVGLGGGVVGDMAGFAAATLFRGVPVVHVPTTLLSMVDSAVGGKTGFDTPHGKNLIGAFHQPSAVLCDLETLTTLPARELAAGLAEVVKSAWIESEAALVALERDAERLLALDTDAIEAAVRMAASMKARVVTADEREAGPRATLNLGHTLGHAIEAAGGYRALLHGEAVSLGLLAALRLSVALGRCEPAHLERVSRLLGRFGLPTDLSPHLGDETMAFLRADKKRRDDVITFALPEAPGAVSLIPLEVSEITRLVRQGGST